MAGAIKSEETRRKGRRAEVGFFCGKWSAYMAWHIRGQAAFPFAEPEAVRGVRACGWGR